MRYAVAIALLLGCHEHSAAHELPRSSSVDYRDGKLWLCRPDLPTDACRVDLATTVLAPDGTRAIEQHAPAHDAPVDCFYIYPTVDLGLVAGNHIDFSDLEPMRTTATAQIARWSEVCNVYAPLYRQVTIGTYFDKVKNRRFFDVAYSDVAAGFHEYLLHHDRGKPIVIVGHSQGAEMAERLLHDTFDHDDALRARLLVAMPIGFLVEVPDGATTGGTFDHLAACTRPDELGCVVNYLTVGEGDEATGMMRWLRRGYHAMCVDPAPGPLLGESVFPARHHEHDVTTTFGSVRGFYSARCVTHKNGRAFLEVSEHRARDDKRPSLISLHPMLSGEMGLHIYDFQLAQGDLIDLVRTKLAAWQARSGPKP